MELDVFCDSTRKEFVTNDVHVRQKVFAIFISVKNPNIRDCRHMYIEKRAQPESFLLSIPD